MTACPMSEAGIRSATTTRCLPMSLKLTASRTTVSPSSRRMTSIPIGLGAGFAMAPKMAMEAMMKAEVVFMMNDLIVLECWTIDQNCI